MPNVDPALPSTFVKQIIGQDGIPQSQWNDELRDLMNPSIEARPLHIPESGRIKTVKNKEYHYFLAFDRCGSDPRHERVESLRGAGWEYATTDDVEMHSAENVKQKNEIRSGDRRLMKIPLLRWREIRKAQNMAAIEMINPRGRSGRNPMGLHNMTPGIPSTVVEDFADLRSKAVESNAAEELTTGQVRGNASRAPKGAS